MKSPWLSYQKEQKRTIASKPTLLMTQCGVLILKNTPGLENRGDADYSDLYPLIWPWLYSWILYYKWVAPRVSFWFLQILLILKNLPMQIPFRYGGTCTVRHEIYAKFNFSDLQYFWYFARTFFCDCERLVFLAGPFKFLFNFNYNTFFLHYIESTGQATADRVVKHGNQCP